MSEKTVNGMHCITEAIHLIISNIIPFLNGTDLHLIIRKEKMEHLCSMLQCLFYRYVQIIVRLFSSQILQKATKGNLLLADSIIVLNLWCLERSDGSYQVSSKYNVQTFSREIIFSSDESNYYFSTHLIHGTKKFSSMSTDKSYDRLIHIQ